MCARRVERAARPLLPAVRRKHFAQRTQTVNRVPGLPLARQMPDAGRVGQRAGRPFHPSAPFPLHACSARFTGGVKIFHSDGKNACTHHRACYLARPLFPKNARVVELADTYV